MITASTDTPTEGQNLMSDNDYFAQRTAQEIGKRVQAFDDGWHNVIFRGEIVGGDFGTGLWIVRADDGTEREFEAGRLQEVEN
jgi:hypothetical protein